MSTVPVTPELVHVMVCDDLCCHIAPPVGEVIIIYFAASAAGAWMALNPRITANAKNIFNPLFPIFKASILVSPFDYEKNGHKKTTLHAVSPLVEVRCMRRRSYGIVSST
jgi:hypothetical protein